MSDQSAEKRQYPRFQLFCPVELLEQSGQPLAKGQTLNLSDGGCLLEVPADAAPAPESLVAVTLRVPDSSSPDAPMREFRCRGRVVRHEDTTQPGKKALAIEFTEPLELGLK